MNEYIKIEKSPKRTFVIGDVHGCYKTLNHLLFGKLKIKKRDKIIFLGDMIDRGPNSKKVIDLIFDLLFRAYKVRCLMGNHELMLLDSLKSEQEFNNWSKHGGKIALKSFNIKHTRELESAYLRFFRSLPYYIETPEFVIVHGGLNFDIENPLSDKAAMPWIRNKEIDCSKIGNRRIIVGHTPVPLKEVHQSLFSEKIMLDGGCVYHNSINGLGYLCALELHTMELFIQPNME